MPEGKLLDYQFRFLDYRNHLDATRDLKFQDDQLACECVERLYEIGAIEVWQKSRFVCRVDDAGMHYGAAVAPEGSVKRD